MDDYQAMLDSIVRMAAGEESMVKEMNTWLPEKGAKYNAKRRQKDLDLVYSNWDLPKEMTKATINIAYVPAKVAKKYKRAVAIHSNDWAMKNEEYRVKYKDMVSRGDKEDSRNIAFHHTTSTLVQMDRVLPTYHSKTIIDIPSDFRKRGGEISGGGGKGSAFNYRFWNIQRLASYYHGVTGRDIDDEG